MRLDPLFYVLKYLIPLRFISNTLIFGTSINYMLQYGANLIEGAFKALHFRAIYQIEHSGVSIWSRSNKMRVLGCFDLELVTWKKGTR